MGRGSARGPLVLISAVVAGTAALTAVMVWSYPSAAPVFAAFATRGSQSAPRPAGRPASTVQPAGYLVVGYNGLGCIEEPEKAELGERMLCEHDLGPQWRLDGGLVGGPAVLCLGAQPMGSEQAFTVWPRFMHDADLHVEEWARRFASAAAAEAAMRQLRTQASRCRSPIAAAAQIPPARFAVPGVSELGSWSLSSAGSSGVVVVLRVGDAVVQLGIVPMTSSGGRPSAAQVQRIVDTALARWVLRLHGGP